MPKQCSLILLALFAKMTFLSSSEGVSQWSVVVVEAAMVVAWVRTGVRVLAVGVPAQIDLSPDSLVS